MNIIDNGHVGEEGRTGPLARLERLYLAGLRIATLAIATILLIYALWLGLSGIWGVSKDAESVEVAQVTVRPDEIAVLPAEAAETGEEQSAADDAADAAQLYYKGFLDKYYALFQTRFERFKQADDEVLTKEEFDRNFLQIALRLEHIENGDLSLSEDQERLESLFTAMRSAADLEVTKKRLSAYKAAKKKRVETKVTKFRDETYCDYYGYYQDECLSYDTRSVPYTETQVSMELPKGVFSYRDLFGSYQDTFIQTLMNRTEQAEIEASNKRGEILTDNEEGSQALALAIKIAGGFLVIMFFFLLIAIERHQRAAAQKQP